MNILFVDDSVERFELFSRALKHENIHILWRTNPIYMTIPDVMCADIIFLDHDMCLYEQNGERCRCRRRNEGCDCPNGTDAVRFLVEQNFGGSVVIHTSNPVGASSMEQHLWAFHITKGIHKAPFMGFDFKTIIQRIQTKCKNLC